MPVYMYGKGRVTNILCYDVDVSTKAIIWVCVILFSGIGGYVPILLGSSFLSPLSVLGNTIGGLFGIWVGFKVGKMVNE